MSLKKHLLLILVLLILFCAALYSQTNLITTYPLKTGNIFVFLKISHSTSYGFDSSYVRCTITKDSVVYNKRYYCFDFFPLSTDTNKFYRFDTLTGNFMMFMPGTNCYYLNEYLMDSLHANLHNGFQSCIYYPFFTHCEDTNSILIFNSVRYARSFYWVFQVGSIGSWVRDKYSNEIGLIYHQSGSSSYISNSYTEYRLKGCVIDGNLYGDTTNYFLGVQQINTEIPGNYYLFQNYPNPFNPNTTIKFDIAKEGNVTIEIYDVLGRTIAILAKDEFKKAGSYVVTWDGSNYPSGIYFYRLITDGYTDTKKMVLIK